MKRKSYHSSDDKVKSFRENIMVVGEEFFSDMNFTDGEVFLKVFIKRKKIQIQLKNLSGTKQHIQKVEINNDCNTQVIQILCEEHYGVFIFKENILSRLPKPIELSYK